MGMNHFSCTELRLDAVGRVCLDFDLAFVCHTLSTCKDLRLDAVGWVGFDLDVNPLVSDIPIANYCVWMPWGGFDERWMCPHVEWWFQLQKLRLHAVGRVWWGLDVASSV